MVYKYFRVNHFRFYGEHKISGQLLPTSFNKGHISSDNVVCRSIVISITHPCYKVLYLQMTTTIFKFIQEYDTLDSSNSGGKTSFDSAGSRNVPEKRSRKLERPKSLTNLVWDFRSGGGTLMQRSSSKPSIIVGGDRKMFDGPFSKRRFSKDYSPGGGIGKKMGSNKMATLYL